MKTTVQIPDSLLEEARKLATREKTTLKALVEERLRLIIAKRKRTTGFRLRTASFKGTGLQPCLDGASWERIQEKIYEGRGGWVIAVDTNTLEYPHREDSPCYTAAYDLLTALAKLGLLG